MLLVADSIEGGVELRFVSTSRLEPPRWDVRSGMTDHMETIPGSLVAINEHDNIQPLTRRESTARRVWHI